MPKNWALIGLMVPMVSFAQWTGPQNNNTMVTDNNLIVNGSITTEQLMFGNPNSTFDHSYPLSISPTGIFYASNPHIATTQIKPEEIRTGSLTAPYLNVSLRSNLQGGLNVTGTTNISGNLNVAGTNNIAGNNNIGGETKIAGNTLISGTLTLEKDLKINGGISWGNSYLTSDQGGSVGLGGNTLGTATPYIDFRNDENYNKWDARFILTSDNRLELRGWDQAMDFRVGGKISATEIEVKPDVWADYVFKPEYKLRSLGETEKFIQSNGHLPGIPSAKEVEIKGLKVGDMNRMMMEKIEELTLHMIELEKKNRVLEQKLNGK